MATLRPLSLSRFLALRYLHSGRRFVSVITLVSLLGVALGVLMMIVVRSVMGGFELEFRQQLIEGRPHVLMQAPKVLAGGWPARLEEVRQFSGVASAIPHAGGVVYASHGDAEAAAVLYGLPESAGPLGGKVRKQLMEGHWPAKADEVALPFSVVSALNLRLGQSVLLYSDRAVNAALSQYDLAQRSDSAAQRSERLAAISLRSNRLRLCGVLEGSPLGDLGVCSLQAARALFDLGEGVGGFALELEQPLEVEEWVQRNRSAFPDWQFEPWTQGEQARLAAMRNEQSMMQFVLAIIALVAAFSVMNVTITITTQKRQEIGVLAALGASPSQIVRIFVNQSALVGFVGSALGLVAALAVLRYREELRQILGRLMGAEVHAVEGVFFSSIPAAIEPLQVALTFGGSWLLCVVAGLLPAWFAARLQCADALRDR